MGTDNRKRASQPDAPTRPSVELSDEKRKRLGDEIARPGVGVARMARWIGCSTEALTRALVPGLRSHRATILLIERATFERDPRTSPEAG